MVDPLTLIQAVSALVTALAAAGILGVAYRLYALVREHDRVLFGEDAVPGWGGIVPMVQANRERSRKNRECLERLKGD